MKTVSATVIRVVPELELVQLLAEDGETTLLIGDLVAGVDWRVLRESQVLLCELDRWEHATRVASARVVARGERL